MKILYSELIFETNPICHYFLTISMASCVAMIIILILFYYGGEFKNRKAEIAAHACLTTFSVCMLLGIGFGIGNKVETGRHRYEVIFEDNYPLKKVYDDYEIIERKGEIWIIEDKNVQRNDTMGGD